MKYKIKWVTLLIAFTFFKIVILNGQKGEFGLRYMPVFTKFDINTSTGGKIAGDIELGYGIGALLGFNFTNHVGLQTEVIYNSYSQKYKDAAIERNINLKYINIPLLLALNTNKSKAINLGIVAGPQIGISVGSKLLSTAGNEPNANVPILSVKKGDLGFAYGAGLDIGLNAAHTFRLGLGFRGVHGLIDIRDQSATIATNSYYILDKTMIKVYSGYAGISFLF